MYPSGFNRAYRCVLKYIRSYVMEELANLIFIGSYIAKCGPPGFLTLWKLLQPALHHYIYGHEDTEAQRDAARDSLRSYAVKLEEFVAAGVVRTHSWPGYICVICTILVASDVCDGVCQLSKLRSAQLALILMYCRWFA